MVRHLDAVIFHALVGASVHPSMSWDRRPTGGPTCKKLLDPDLLDALGLAQSKQHIESGMPRESEKQSTGCPTNSETSSSCCSGGENDQRTWPALWAAPGQPCMTVWPGRWSSEKVLNGNV